MFGPVRFVTLTPGDVFLTGTPPGVGVFRKPPVYLKVISQVQQANSKVLISESSTNPLNSPYREHKRAFFCTFFQKGDVVECQIEHLGSIINKVV